jgi:hypothetical protein
MIFSLQKDDFQRRCTRFEECFLFDFDVVRSEIIIKSSFETHHIIDKWCCCSRCRCHRIFISELRSFFESSDRLASRRSSARLESSLKRLVGWVSWHQKVWASNAKNLDLWTRIFKHSIFRNFHFEKFSIHKTHQI